VKELFYIGIGGFFGAVARFAVSRMANNFTATFPLGTLLVNITGSFFLGFILYSTILGKSISPELRSFLAIGLIGAFTTMSTFSYETIRLFETNNSLFAWGNIFLNIILCFGGIILGRNLAFLLIK